VTALWFQTALESDPGQHPDDATRVAPARSLRLRDAVHAHIRFVLHRTKGNKRRAARELGIARETLERKLRKMNNAGDRPGDSR